MISEDDSIVLDSDEQDSSNEESQYINKLNMKKKKHRPVIIDSDDEEDDEIISSDTEFEDSGRLTPSIHKAIRRSILNISQHEIINDSDTDSHSDDASDEQDASQISTDEVQMSPQKSTLPSKTIEAIRQKIFQRSTATIISSDSDDNHDHVQILNTNKPQTVIAIDSDSEESRDNIDLSEAVAVAKNESNNTTLNYKDAQTRAMIICEMQKIEREMKKSKIFLQEGNLDLLPDKGQKLHINIAKHSERLNELRVQLEKMPLIESDVVNKIKIKDDNYDPKDFLKPTVSANIGEFGPRAMKTFQREQALTVDRLEDLHGSLLSRPTEDTRAQDPHGLRVNLMPHQQHALAWLLWREQQKPAGGVLADDMGLGKTLTMISLIMTSLIQQQTNNDDDDEDDDNDNWIQKGRAVKHRGGTLVVCPASLISQWDSEIKNRCKRGLLMVEVYHGNNRETQPRRLARNNVVITTYNLLTREYKNHGVIYNIDWKRIILDEAHVIRNHKSQACEAVCGILARKRWALTGTPIHNKEMDLYAILKFLKCSPFDDIRVWKRWVDNKNAAGHERLATVMKSLMLRRTKQELMNNGSLNALPEKTLEIINVKLDHDERLIYEKILIYSKTLFAQFLSQRAEKQHNFELGAGKFDKFIDSASYKNTQFNRAQKELLARHADVKQHEILVLLLRLRQVCCHPSLIHSMLDRDDLEVNDLDDGTNNDDLMNSIKKLNLNSDSQEIDGDVGVDERVVEHLLTSDNPVFDRTRKSSKLRALLELIEEIMETDEKIIIVSQWTSNLEIIAEQLKSIKGATYKMFTGAVAVKNRQDIIDSFNSKHKDPQILLLSLTAGGVGLNLVGANHLLLIDIHWNPQLESQAQDRIYRFGQKKNVFIYKFICTDTIEERIKNLQDKKLEIASAVLTGTHKNVGSKLSLNDLKSLFNM